MNESCDLINEIMRYQAGHLHVSGSPVGRISVYVTPCKGQGHWRAGTVLWGQRSLTRLLHGLGQFPELAPRSPSNLLITNLVFRYTDVRKAVLWAIERRSPFVKLIHLLAYRSGDWLGLARFL